MILPVAVRAQLAVKTNVVYDALTTPNLGAEWGCAPQQSVNLVYGLNPWSYTSDSGIRKARHWVVMPEWRWWFCTRFNGHFVGAHLMGGQFNAENVKLPVPGAFFGGENLTRAVRDYRCQGWFAGIGATYGYQFILARHWNIEAEIGVGYNHVWFDRYNLGKCGGHLADGHSNYVGVTKLGLSVLYIF